MVIFEYVHVNEKKNKNRIVNRNNFLPYLLTLLPLELKSLTPFEKFFALGEKTLVWKIHPTRLEFEGGVIKLTSTVTIFFNFQNFVFPQKNIFFKETASNKSTLKTSRIGRVEKILHKIE